MRVTIDYVDGKPHYISFEYSDLNDSRLLPKIVEKLLGEKTLPDYTYAMGKCELSLTYNGGGIKLLTIEDNSDLIQRVIHLTVGNHWHMLQRECLEDEARNAAEEKPIVVQC